ncbi:TPR-like protein [Backusella circina FSU 941]|nr:TPR-like protein [Backusella circina FSU 941]
MTPAETFEKGVEYRLAGNASFKEQNWKSALTNYYSAILHLKTVGGQQEKEEYKKKSEEQLVLIYNNMCAVFSKQDKWDRVLSYAKKAEELDPDNIKAKFRLGQAYSRAGDLENAKSYLTQVQEKNPNDPLVKSELSKLNSEEKKSEDKQRAIYRAMMTKFAGDS